MNHKQKKRLITIISLFILISAACSLILFALKQNINLFYTPTQLMQTEVRPQQTIRLGGYVKTGSVNFDSSGQIVNFIITDRTHEIKIHYRGVLPNLFREKQAVVVTGKLNNQQGLDANQVLAKHDEKYIPKQLADEINKGANHDT